jgi:hypothetical protein
MEFASLYENESENLRGCLIKTKTFIAYQRQLNNLSIQENRLSRQRDKDTAALADLQQPREKDADHQDEAQRQSRSLDQAAASLLQAMDQGTEETWDQTPFGFEFSKNQICDRAFELMPLRTERKTETKAASNLKAAA